MSRFVTKMYLVFVCVGVFDLASSYGKIDPFLTLKLNIFAIKIDSRYIYGKDLISIIVCVCLDGSPYRKRLQIIFFFKITETLAYVYQDNYDEMLYRVFDYYAKYLVI